MAKLTSTREIIEHLLDPPIYVTLIFVEQNAQGVNVWQVDREKLTLAKAQERLTWLIREGGFNAYIAQVEEIRPKNC